MNAFWTSSWPKHPSMKRTAPSLAQASPERVRLFIAIRIRWKKSMDSHATKVERHILTLRGATWDILQPGGARDMISLFPGNSSSYLTYSKLLASPLADKYHLVAVNLPWHGLSRPPKVDLLSIPSMASMVLELIAYFSPKRFMLVGHSVGGHILGHLADRVSNCGGIVLISAPPISLPSL